MTGQESGVVIQVISSKRCFNAYNYSVTCIKVLIEKRDLSNCIYEGICETRTDCWEVM